MTDGLTKPLSQVQYHRFIKKFDFWEDNSDEKGHKASKDKKCTGLKWEGVLIQPSTTALSLIHEEPGIARGLSSSGLTS